MTLRAAVRDISLKALCCGSSRMLARFVRERPPAPGGSGGRREAVGEPAPPSVSRRSSARAHLCCAYVADRNPYGILMHEGRSHRLAGHRPWNTRPSPQCPPGSFRKVSPPAGPALLRPGRVHERSDLAERCSSPNHRTLCRRRVPCLVGRRCSSENPSTTVNRGSVRVREDESDVALWTAQRYIRIGKSRTTCGSSRTSGGAPGAGGFVSPRSPCALRGARRSSLGCHVVVDGGNLELDCLAVSAKQGI